MKKIFLILVASVVLKCVYSQQIVWDDSSLKLAYVNRDDAKYRRAIDVIVRKADGILKLADFPSVTKKKKSEYSEDLHHYLSFATYAWPNPETKDGLPYIIKDGKTNKNAVREVQDYSRLIALSDRIETLALAYYFTKEKKYASRLASLARVWFIHPESKMAPNFNHAQVVKGRNNGRIEGIIEARFFIPVLDGIQLAYSAGAFPDSDYLSMKEWFRSFKTWMEVSTTGKKGMNLKNNIGTSYQMQRMAFNIFIGDPELNKQILSENVEPLLAKQFGDRGEQSLELRRTKSQQYSIANLRYWLDIKSILSNSKLAFSDQQEAVLERGFNYLSQNGEVDDDSHNRRFKQMGQVWRKKDFLSNLFSKNTLDLDSYENAVFVLTRGY